MDFLDCVSFAQARQIIENAISKKVMLAEYVDLSNSLSRVCAVDNAAQDNLPGFDRSTVDGFAVNSPDTFGAGEGIPAILEIVGEVGMGQAAGMQLQAGQAVGIATGGMLPAGADAVAMLEHTEQPDSSSIMVKKPVAPGENVVTRDEDVKAGQTIIKKARRITPADIGLLAACGCSRIAVRKRPKAVVISTGDELVDIKCNCKPGQVRDINSYSLTAALWELGCEVISLGIVKDNYESIVSALRQSIEQGDVVIVSGGSSVGTKDHTVKAIGELGEPGVLFHGVATKPGKPTIFGVVNGVPIFGLPGHPTAALMTFSHFVKFAIRLLLGQTIEQNILLPAKITRSMASMPGRDDFIMVKLKRNNGEYLAEPILGKSGLIRTITEADGIVHIPSDSSGLYAGSTVEVRIITGE